MTRHRSAFALPLVSVVLVSLSACSTYGSNANTGSGGGSSPAASTDLTVFAASSLTGAFTALGKTFEQQHPGTHVTFNFGASDDLAGQIQSEGTADVFASASPTWMDAVQKKPGVNDRSDFARNTLIIIVPQGTRRTSSRSTTSRTRASSSSSRRRASRSAITPARRSGTPDREAGRGERRLQRGGRRLRRAEDLHERGGRGDRVQLRHRRPSGAGVESIAIPDSDNVIATYPIAVVTGAPQSQLATQFVGEVTGSSGESVLKTYGFLPPPSG
jgi:molybdate transport system substrate-binding protein